MNLWNEVTTNYLARMSFFTYSLHAQPFAYVHLFFNDHRIRTGMDEDDVLEPRNDGNAGLSW